MSPNQAIPTDKSIYSPPLAAAQPLTILSWSEALNASGFRRACPMAIRRNSCSLLISLCLLFFTEEAVSTDKSSYSSKLVPRRPSLATARLSSLLLWTGRLTPRSIGLPTGRPSRNACPPLVGREENNARNSLASPLSGPSRGPCFQGDRDETCQGLEPTILHYFLRGPLVLSFGAVWTAPDLATTTAAVLAW
jgi:hypothetical protein